MNIPTFYDRKLLSKVLFEYMTDELDMESALKIASMDDLLFAQYCKQTIIHAEANGYINEVRRLKSVFLSFNVLKSGLTIQSYQNKPKYQQN
jgi:hypothetical protein